MIFMNAVHFAAAAKRYKVVTQMGNQGGSGDGVRKGQEMYDTGMIGDVHTVQAWTNRPVWPQGLPTPTGNFPVPAEVDWDCGWAICRHR